MEQPSFLLSSENWPNLNKSINERQVERNKKCDICPFVTHKNQNLKNHKKIHEKVTPIIHECKGCPKQFTELVLHLPDLISLNAINVLN